MCLIHRGHTWMTSTKYRRFRAPLPLCPYIFQCFPIFITLPSTFWQNPPPPPCVDVNYVCSLIQNAIEYLIFFCEFKVPQIVLNLVYCTKMNSLCELLGPQNESLLHYLANTRLLQRKFRTISPPQKGRSKNRNWNYYINTLYRVFCLFGNGFNSISWLHFTSDFNDRTLWSNKPICKSRIF